jgi:tripartite-type tricarboxylate transporter receptor subunit TctC
MAHVQARRRALMRSAAGMCLTGVVFAMPWQISAQGYPVKPVRVIVPYAAGGAGDIMGRVYGQKLAELLGQPFVVELRPGAAGMLGTAAVAKSAPDGYVVLLGAQAETTVNQNLYSKMSYDPLKDLVPVAMAGILPLVLVVTPALPARSVKEYVALARGRPGELTYGTAGHGTTAHLGMEYLRRAAGIDLVHVTYKGGSEVVTAVAGGHVMSFLSGIPPALPHIQSGRLRAIGISTKDRVQVLADVPTLAEGGIKGFDIANWFGYFTPAGTARDVIARLNTGVQTAIRDPEVRKVLDRQGIVPLETTPDDFARFTASEARKYAQIIRESGIRIE